MAKDLKKTKTNWHDIPHSWLLASESSKNTKTESGKHKLMTALQNEDFKIELLNAAVKS